MTREDGQSSAVAVRLSIYYIECNLWCQRRGHPQFITFNKALKSLTISEPPETDEKRKKNLKMKSVLTSQQTILFQFRNRCNEIFTFNSRAVRELTNDKMK